MKERLRKAHQVQSKCLQKLDLVERRQAILRLITNPVQRGRALQKLESMASDELAEYNEMLRRNGHIL